MDMVTYGNTCCGDVSTGAINCTGGSVNICASFGVANGQNFVGPGLIGNLTVPLSCRKNKCLAPSNKLSTGTTCLDTSECQTSDYCATGICNHKSAHGMSCISGDSCSDSNNSCRTERSLCLLPAASLNIGDTGCVTFDECKSGFCSADNYHQNGTAIGPPNFGTCLSTDPNPPAQSILVSSLSSLDSSHCVPCLVSFLENIPSGTKTQLS